MNLENGLKARSGDKCELCSANDHLSVYEVPPVSSAGLDECVLICEDCLQQIESPEKVDVHHWHCLNDSMWSQVPVVQVMVWRMLNHLSSESWAQDLLDMLYLDDELLKWAQADGGVLAGEDAVKHVDSNGNVLQNGDTVTLIKDLNVKGANFTAKRGTAVRGISLVADNPEQIEGKVSGQLIVILCKFVKKA